MGTISSLSTAGRALRRNPVLFAGTFIAAVIGLLSAAVGFVVGANSPGVAGVLTAGLSFVIAVFVSPFIQGGILGMAREAIAGRTTLGAFVSEGRRNYIRIFLANILYFLLFLAIALVYGIIVVVGALVAGVAVSSGGGLGGVGTGALVVVGVLTLVFVVALVLASLFFQFYKAAIVTENAGTVASFKRSASAVRGNFVGTIGYNLLAGLIGLIPAFPSLYATLSSLSLSDPAAAGAAGVSSSGDITLAVASAVLGFLIGAFLRTYFVAFYTDSATERVDDAPEPNTPLAQP